MAVIAQEAWEQVSAYADRRRAEQEAGALKGEGIRVRVSLRGGWFVLEVPRERWAQARALVIERRRG